MFAFLAGMPLNVLGVGVGKLLIHICFFSTRAHDCLISHQVSSYKTPHNAILYLKVEVAEWV